MRWFELKDGKEVLQAKGKVLEMMPERRLRHSNYSPSLGLPDEPENYTTVDFTLDVERDGRTHGCIYGRRVRRTTTCGATGTRCRQGMGGGLGRAETHRRGTGPGHGGLRRSTRPVIFAAPLEPAMAARFPQYEELDAPKVAEEVLKQWEAEDTFGKSLALHHKNAPPFVFYEGPPSANGLPGIHHVMARAIEDIFCRYQTQGPPC